MTLSRYSSQIEPLELEQDLHLQRLFLYGDGHFTTIKIVDGQPQLLALHIKRLQKANHALSFGFVDFIKLTELLLKVAKSYQLGWLKVQISRGESARGYGITDDMRPELFISHGELPVNQYSTAVISERPLQVADGEFQLGIQPALSAIKHCNRLEQVMVSTELGKIQADDLIISDINNQVIETSKANLLFVINNQWFTPKLTGSGIDGVMLQAIRLSNPQISVTSITPEQLQEKAQAIFLSNSLIGLQGVTQYNGKQYSPQTNNKWINSLTPWIK